MSEWKHTVSWFEIPVVDLERAAAFYGTLLGVDLKASEYGPVRMAVFPTPGDGEQQTVHGALVSGRGYIPSESGSLLYLAAGRDLSETLARVEPAGGTVIQDKMSIGDHGFIALFRDTEGNRVALHSPE